MERTGRRSRSRGCLVYLWVCGSTSSRVRGIGILTGGYCWIYGGGLDGPRLDADGLNCLVTGARSCVRCRVLWCVCCLLYIRPRPPPHSPSSSAHPLSL
ncbi:hypothetical protein DFH09DRAFT_1215076, partial [Mycena vulgaris]